MATSSTSTPPQGTPAQGTSAQGTSARVARPRPKVMTLTERAADRIRAIIAKSETSIAGLRVGVKNGGCAGMEYTMEYATAAAPTDEVVEDKGVTILIDPKAVLFLLGTEMDYKTERLSSGFVFNNPNQTGACGCGESIVLTPATPDRLGEFSS